MIALFRLRVSASLLFAALTLASCFPSSTEWVKEGASADELRITQRDCERSAGDYSFIESSTMSDPAGAPRSSAQRAAGSVAGDSYRRCMEGQGWRRQRPGQQPTAAK